MNDLTSTRAPQLAFSPQSTPQQGSGVKSNDKGNDGDFLPFGSDGLTFFDLIDVINPLQHIPVISTLYRNITGDTLDPASHVAGGALFGGPIGAVASLVNVIVDENTGKDIGEHVFAFFSNEAKEDSGLQFAKDDSSDKGRFVLENYDVVRWAQGEVPSMPAPVQVSELEPLQATKTPAITGAELELLRAENLHASRPASEHVEVFQWALQESLSEREPKAAVKRDPLLAKTLESNNMPVITGAELDLLRAEAEAIVSSRKSADISVPKASPTPRSYPNDTMKAALNESFQVVENMDVMQWANRETYVADRDRRMTERSVTATDNNQQPKSLPAGAMAQEGGWFTEVMLSALNSYQQGAKLGAVSPALKIDRRD